jgi:hypothetical protein
MNGEPPVARQWGETHLQRGITAGIALAVLGPALAILVTAYQVKRSFQAVSGPGVEPSEKARHLATGISEAMNFSALGILVTLAGVVLAIVCAVKLSRRRRAQQGDAA